MLYAAAGQMYAAVGRCDGSITVYDVLEGGIAAEIEPDRQANRGKEPEDRYAPVRDYSECGMCYCTF